MSNELRKAFLEQGHFDNIVADCPHCGARSAAFQYHGQVGFGRLNTEEGEHTVLVGACRSCGGVVVGDSRKIALASLVRKTIRLIYPTGVTWPDKAPANLDPEIKKDYDEARAVLAVSARAAAALARRCLQHVIRRKMGIKKKNLFEDIEAACESDELSKPIKAALHDVRTIGAWSAHPCLDQSDALIEVEPEDAEYTLETVELLFEDLYKLPDRRETMKAKLGRKKQGQANPEPAE